MVRQVLREGDGGVNRESVRAFAEQLMESEVFELIGTEHGDWTAGRGATGIGARCWKTRAGGIESPAHKMRQLTTSRASGGRVGARRRRSSE